MVIKATPLDNKYIPAILAAGASALALLWVLSGTELTGWQSVLTAVFTGITQGVVAWLIAWTSYEKGIKMLGVATENQGGGEE